MPCVTRSRSTATRAARMPCSTARSSGWSRRTCGSTTPCRRCGAPRDRVLRAPPGARPPQRASRRWRRTCARPVVGLSSLPAPAGWQGDWLQLARDDDPSPSASDDVSARGVLHWAPRHHRGLSARMATLASWFARERPAAVVVDVSVEVALLARLCGTPSSSSPSPGSGPTGRTSPPTTSPTPPRPVAGARRTPGAGRRRGPTRPGAWAACRGSTAGPPAAAVRGTREARRVLLLWGAGGRDTDASAVEAARRATPGWTGPSAARTGPRPTCGRSCARPTSWSPTPGRTPSRTSRRPAPRPSSSPSAARSASRRRPPGPHAGWASPTGTAVAVRRPVGDAAGGRAPPRRRGLVAGGAPGRGDAGDAAGSARSRPGSAGRTAVAARRGARVTAPRLAVVTIVRGRHAHLAGQIRGLLAPGPRAPTSTSSSPSTTRQAHDVVRDARPGDWDVRSPGTGLRGGADAPVGRPQPRRRDGDRRRCRAPRLPRRRLRPEPRPWSRGTASPRRRARRRWSPRRVRRRGLRATAIPARRAGRRRPPRHQPARPALPAGDGPGRGRRVVCSGRCPSLSPPGTSPASAASTRTTVGLRRRGHRLRPAARPKPGVSWSSWVARGPCTSTTRAPAHRCSTSATSW